MNGVALFKSGKGVYLEMHPLIAAVDRAVALLKAYAILRIQQQ
jgi:hypothetical protein